MLFFNVNQFKECVEEKEKADGEVISQEEFWRKIDVNIHQTLT